MNQRNISILMFCLASTWMSGCGQAPTSGVGVRGSITVDRSPLAEGLITFVPAQGTSGQKCSVMILNGKYVIEPAEGLAAGEYRVEVMGLPPGVKAMAEGKVPSHAPSSYREIDPAFNEKSNLKCTLQASVENMADFSVKYAP